MLSNQESTLANTVGSSLYNTVNDPAGRTRMFTTVSRVGPGAHGENDSVQAQAGMTSLKMHKPFGGNRKDKLFYKEHNRSTSMLNVLPKF